MSRRHRNIWDALSDRVVTMPGPQWAAIAATGNLVAVAISGWLVAKVLSNRFAYFAVLIPAAFVYYLLWYRFTLLRTSAFPYHPNIVVRTVREISEWRRTAQSYIQARNVRSEDLIAQLKELLRRIREIVKSDSDPRGFGVAHDSGIDVCIMSETLQDNLVRPDGTRPVTCVTCATRDPITKVRFKSEPHIYDNSEAAKIYAALRRGEEPEVRIVSDTLDQRFEFDHIDTGAAAIGSMVIAPLRRPLDVGERTLIVGCLVITSTKRNYFKETDVGFWRDFIDLIGSDVVLIMEAIEENARPSTASRGPDARAPW